MMQEELYKLNSRLQTLQVKLFSEAIKIDSELNNRVINLDDSLDDYELTIEISFFLNENDLVYKKDEDNILATITEYVKGISQKEDKYPYTLEVNHNEFQNWKHPMSDEYHCWWYHCLYDHNNLSWEDMKKIGVIWSDIKVQYQYFDEDTI